jgi:hypothetical protein
MLYKSLLYPKLMQIKDLVEQEEQAQAIAIDFIVHIFLDKNFSRTIFLKFKEQIYAMLFYF